MFQKICTFSGHSSALVFVRSSRSRILSTVRRWQRLRISRSPICDTLSGLFKTKKIPTTTSFLLLKWAMSNFGERTLGLRALTHVLCSSLPFTPYYKVRFKAIKEQERISRSRSDSYREQKGNRTTFSKVESISLHYRSDVGSFQSIPAAYNPQQINVSETPSTCGW